MKKRKLIPVIIVCIIIVPFIVGAVYFSFYYHADEYALSALESSDNVTVLFSDESVSFIPGSPECGLIFYPGGKVEYTAYAPMMRSLAEENILCVIPDMPLNISLYNIDAADDIISGYPQISSWYIGGHSLGGVAASAYASKHYDRLEGLILLGSYSSFDISSSGLDVISIYGSNDTVINYENYTRCLDNLPDDHYEYVINGGCHCYFGSYGSQKGDGTPDISREEQIHQTVEQITLHIR